MTTTRARPTSCRRRPRSWTDCWTTSAPSVTTRRCRRSSRPRWRMPSSRRSTRSMTATAAPAEQWCRCCSGAAVSPRRYVPPISVVLAAERDRYISGLVHYRQGELTGWVEQFAVAAARAAHLARAYPTGPRAAASVAGAASCTSSPPRSDAVAWRLIDVLPAHPIITLPVGVAATGRSKPQVNAGLDQLATAGVLAPLSRSGTHCRRGRQTGSLSAQGLGGRAVTHEPEALRDADRTRGVGRAAAPLPRSGSGRVSRGH